MSEFVEFHSRYPQLAERETRTVTIVGRDTIPEDTYAFAEAFCVDQGCDCRRAFLNVYARSKRRMVATIGYGWESRDFYRTWFGSESPTVDEMVGVGLPPGTVQSALSPRLLEIFAGLVREDAEYAERIKRHYAMFKEALGKRQGIRPFTYEEDDGEASVEECLDVLRDLDLDPSPTWFQDRPAGCTSAMALLDLHAPGLNQEDRIHARPYVRRLWEQWVPDLPCVENRYEEAFSYLEEAGPASSRDALESGWRRWLFEIADVLFDDDGRMLKEAVRAVEGEGGAEEVIEGLLCEVVPMLTPPVFQPALDLFRRLDAGGIEGARRFDLVRGMELFHRGDVPAALKLFDRLARQEAGSLAVHLAAGQGVLAVAGNDASLLRQAEWYLTRARQRMDSLPGWDPSPLYASLEALYVRTGQASKAATCREMAGRPG